MLRSLQMSTKLRDVFDPSTGYAAGIKVMKHSQAYWKADADLERCDDGGEDEGDEHDDAAEEEGSAKRRRCTCAPTRMSKFGLPPPSFSLLRPSR